MRTPLQPLPPDQKAILAKEVRSSQPGAGLWFQGLAILWLHFCHELGVKPADARARDGAPFRQVEKVWLPAAASLAGIPSSAMSAKWSRDVATHAAQLHTRALQERAELAGAQPLMVTG